MTFSTEDRDNSCLGVRHLNRSWLLYAPLLY